MEVEKLTHLKCLKCKEMRPRRSFFPNLGREDGLKIRDKLCTKCRKYIHKTATNNVVLWNRVQAGLMDEERYNAIVAAKKEKKTRTGARNLREGLARANMATWEDAHKSAYKAQRILKKFVPLNDDEAVWVARANDLIHEALAEIRVKKRQSKLPEDTLFFWYNALTGGAGRLRRLVAEFPRGSEHAPLQAL